VPVPARRERAWSACGRVPFRVGSPLAHGAIDYVSNLSGRAALLYRQVRVPRRLDPWAGADEGSA
jgi:hypothetical protein